MTRRLVLVTGPPAAGKSSVARPLADALGFPLLSKDAIKETLFDTVGTGDVAWSRRLGAASMELLFVIGRRLSDVVIDCNFNAASAARFASDDTAIVEVFCRVPPEVAQQRFAARTRHPGHCDDERAPEVVEWVAQSAPLDLGPVLEVDTTRAVDLDAIIAWVDGTLASLSGNERSHERNSSR